MPISQRNSFSERARDPKLVTLVAFIAIALTVATGVYLASGDTAEDGYVSTYTPSVQPPRDERPVVFPTAADAAIRAEFSAIPDGSISRPFRTYDNGGNASRMRVEGGAVRHGESEAENSASYMEASLPSDVQRIGATVVLEPDGGSVALTAWQDSIVDSRVGGHSVPNAGLHLVLSPDSWSVGNYDSALRQHRVVTAGYYPHDVVADGVTPYSFELIRDEDTVTIRFPDGTSQDAISPVFEDWIGAWPSWDLYERYPQMTPARIIAAWAS
ncbi:hypothetical protein [Rhodococcus jostii]|uniref:Uncharacterized protein n=1 Tax=Rhodococcus jostii TaxID=132919 RepID=A0ABU4CAL1_RHOJO|nr:hypothetical protein [Rhodococcus jostii]MDV6280282.1 hypothetical protein [Rhodococcus jostii]